MKIFWKNDFWFFRTHTGVVAVPFGLMVQKWAAGFAQSSHPCTPIVFDAPRLSHSYTSFVSYAVLYKKNAFLNLWIGLKCRNTEGGVKTAFRVLDHLFL
jgi:hypothetical protein